MSVHTYTEIIREKMMTIKTHPFNKKTLKTKQLTLAALCTSVLALAACQPKNQENTDSNDAQSTEMTDHEKMGHTDADHDSDEHELQMQDSHEGHDMSTAATTEFGKEYMDEMDDMHEDMMEALQSHDADVTFAKGMLAHHEGALDMAEIQLKYGKDDTMRKLAQDVMSAQQAEIDQIKAWLNAHPDSTEQDYNQEMQQAYSSGMDAVHDEMMQGLLDADADMAFAKGMLAHHKGAIAMAETQLKYGKDEAMRKLAEDIISAQQAEIDLMQKWVSKSA